MKLKIRNPICKGCIIWHKCGHIIPKEATKCDSKMEARG